MTHNPITINIQPVPASRPRVTKFKNKKTGKIQNRTFYLKTYQTYKDALKEMMSQVWKSQSFTKPVSAKVIFQFEVPASWSKKKRNSFLGKPMVLTKGDLDNLEKGLYDAMNEIVFEDDTLVWNHQVVKIWGSSGSITFMVKEDEETFNEEDFFK
jgi:Holliday junction resolvase RusA-like endonuclease